MIQIDLKSSEGNIFEVLGKAIVHLHDVGQSDKVMSLRKTVFLASSYEDALQAISEATDGFIQYKHRL